MSLMEQCADHIEKKRRLAERLCRMLALSAHEEYVSPSGYRFLKITRPPARYERAMVADQEAEA